MKYSIDTSSLLDAAVRWYPRDVFISLWKRIDELFDTGVIVASEEVRHELSRKNDDMKDWATTRAKKFLTHIEPIQVAVAEILTRFPKLVDQSSGKSFGDPFVIAVAKVHRLTVITGESFGNERKPRIPFVCKELDIPCTNTLGLLRAEDIRFE